MIVYNENSKIEVGYFGRSFIGFGLVKKTCNDEMYSMGFRKENYIFGIWNLQKEGWWTAPTTYVDIRNMITICQNKKMKFEESRNIWFNYGQNSV